MSSSSYSKSRDYHNYFNLGLIGMAVTSPEKGWVEVNDKLCEIFGYPKEELIKLTWTEITHPDDIDADVAQFNRVLAGEIDGYSMDKRFVRKDGTLVYASISANCIRKDDGSVDHFVAFVHDISDRKKYEQELQKMNADLELLVAERTRELEEANRKLKLESETDFVTKLPNRRVYERRLDENVASARRDRTQLSLLLIDIDDFKAFNDHYGHDGGDQALKDVARSIESSLPRTTDLAARFGGEEFVVLLPSTDADGALNIAERIRANIQALNVAHVDSLAGVLTVSIGIESMPSETLDKALLFKHADRALYSAKDRGKNCCYLFAES